MPKQSEPIGDLHEAPQRFLETDEFQEMLQTYAKLSPMAGEKKTFESQLAQYDFQRIYPLLDLYLKSHDLTTPEKISQTVQEAAPDTVALASTLLDLYETTLAAHIETEYDLLGNSPATYFICGVWANMKRGREFHPASNGITVTYSEPDAYGNQNIRYRNKDYEMTLIFEAVQEYTRNLSWTAHRLLVYTLMKGNTQNWRDNAVTFNITEYMDWAGLKSRDAAYRQLKKDVQSITGVKLTAESFKKYFESFYTTHLATEAAIKKYTGEVRIAFAENVRHFLTQYYQLIPDWMGHLSENAYRMAFSTGPGKPPSAGKTPSPSGWRTSSSTSACPPRRRSRTATTTRPSCAPSTKPWRRSRASPAAPCRCPLNTTTSTPSWQDR